MTITTIFDVADWVYGYRNGEVYSGEIKSIAVAVDVNEVTTISYQVGSRINMSLQSELAVSKAALTTQMETAEDNSNTSTKASLTTAITALSENELP